MTRRRRTSILLSLFAIASLLLVQSSGGAQSNKYSEDIAKANRALNQKNYEAAVAAYKDSLRDSRPFTGAALATANVQINLGLGRAYLGLGAFKTAIRHCDEALRFADKNSKTEGEVRNLRGMALAASASKPGDPILESAVAEFRKAATLYDTDPLVSYNLGVALLRLSMDTQGSHELQMYIARAGRTPEAETARRMIAQPRRARENFAPDFSVVTLDGEYLTLEDLKGKVVLLDFWGSWCGPCREATPSLVTYSRKHSSETFAIVGIAVNEANERDWRTYIEKNKMKWPQYLDSSHKIANLFKVTAYPTYITLDADGVIRDTRTGWGVKTMAYLDDQVKQAEKLRPAAPETVRTAGTPLSVTPAAAPSLPNKPAVDGVSVRGRVTGPAASPQGVPQPTRATLLSSGTPPIATSVDIFRDGTFEFANVQPGIYTASISALLPTRKITVGAEDLSGLEFTAPAMKSVTVRVAVESAGAAAPRQTYTVSYPEGNVSMAPDSNGRMVLPEGSHVLRLFIPGYTVKSMAYGSADVLNGPIVIGANDREQLLVTLAANSPAPAGTQPSSATTTQPRVLSQVQAKYTEEAAKARVQGDVILDVVVLKNGTPDSIRIVQGLGYGLDEAAVAAMKQWRFQPGARNGQPADVAIRMVVTFKFF